ncbi:MAG: chromosome segregation protein SMC [Clostridiaceae bacterium]|nr:chromosome segregation protein SMC [Clostridiaceae bacterium]
MYLKSIEIQGFKSFPDKTVLTFSDGITAVVGPNGSGKSNIADAIRWVLGEQSAKTLRGGKMEDVIFGGTKRRSPMGFCEVSITIDNSDGAVPLEYTDVTVTRRYYRSGESDFFINRRSARLKDVRELFMDTGLGRDGYSMIGQGRIDEILSVRSEDRREIFEEAAGISKVRLRKEESGKKLDQAEENLVRIRDIITELELRVDPLKKQAEKAKKFLMYRDELRSLEVSSAVDSLERLDGLIKIADIDLDNAERLLSARKSELELLYEKSSKYSENIGEKDVLIEAARGALDKAKAEAAEVSSEKAVTGANIKNAYDNLAMRLREADAQSLKSEELSSQINGKKERLSQVESLLEKNTGLLSELQEEIEQSSRQTEDRSRRLEGLKASHTMLRERERSKLSEVMSLNAALAEMDGRAENIFWEQKDAGEKLNRQTELLEEIEGRLSAAMSERDSSVNTIKGFELMQRVREEKSRKTAEAYDFLLREKNAKTDRLSMLRTMEREYEGFSFAVKKIMQAGKGLSGIHGPLSALIKTEDTYSPAIETALGSAMQNVVVDDENSAKAAIGYLKSNNLGRATFLPMTSVKPRWAGRKALEGERGFCGYGDGLVECEGRYRDIVSSFLGTTAVVDNIDSAIAMGKKYKYAFRIVTLDGQLVNAGGAMTGGSMAKSAGVLTRANEADRLEIELRDIELELSQRAEAKEKAARELAALTYSQKTAADELRRAEEQIALVNAEKSREAALAESLQQGIARLKREHEEYEGRKAVHKEKIKVLEAEAEEITQKSEELTLQIDELSKGAEEDSGKAGAIEEKMSSLKLEINSLQAEITALVDSVTMIERLMTAASGETAEKQAEAEKVRLEIASLEALVALSEKKIESCEQRRKEAEGRISELMAQRLALEGEKSRNDRDIQTKNGEIINQERLRLSLENKKGQLEQERKAVLDRLWEAYELTRTTAREIYQKPQDPQGCAKRISELKGSIKVLGSVNLDSIDEFEEVNTRYTFMAAQRDDLEKAKADLSEIIEKLTESMEDTFIQSFKQINESFSKTFTDIFGGGTAYLRLEDEKNILECGIEINVELPGKGVRAISLLSGGEKAFVAIALYFAIIKVSPTPFCVLDEIDAALDDVNVTRFVEYMRSLCQGTQFIVITHRRGTMEGSDILYGATMQEYGVTKLLKLDINEVESRLNIKLS